MRSVGWKEDAVEEGMRIFEEVKNRARGKSSGRPKAKIAEDDDDDDGDDDDGNEPSVVVEIPKKKRAAPSSSSSHGEGIVSEVSRQLKDFGAKFDQALSMMGAQGLPVYTKTEHWRQVKEKALADALKTEFPLIRAEVKNELVVKWEPIIIAELRKKHGQQEQQQDEEQQAVVHAVLSKRHRVESSPPPQPPPTEIDPWQLALQEHANNLTE